MLFLCVCVIRIEALPEIPSRAPSLMPEIPPLETEHGGVEGAPLQPSLDILAVRIFHMCLGRGLEGVGGQSLIPSLRQAFIRAPLPRPPEGDWEPTVILQACWSCERLVSLAMLCLLLIPELGLPPPSHKVSRDLLGEPYRQD